MTIHEMRICYPHYRLKEWLLEVEKGVDNQIEREKMERPGRELSTRPGLTPVTDKE